MVLDALRCESVAVILVDLAEGPLSAVSSIPRDELRQSAGGLVELCSVLEIPVIAAHAPLPGDAGRPLQEPGADVRQFVNVDHSTNDCWESPAFVRAVEATGRRQLVFAGIALDVGVGLTALSAVRAGYQAAVLVDVCGTTSARAEQAAYLRLAQAGVALTTWTAFAGEIQRDYNAGKGSRVLELVARSVFRRTRLTGHREE